MKILVLSFYFSPDLSAGSFRTQSLVKQLQEDGHEVHVITSMPNRYRSFSMQASGEEAIDKLRVSRVSLPKHKSGMIDQAKAYSSYYFGAMKLVNKESYDLVYATSSRLFTAFLGARISAKKKIPLYLDIRDIFIDTLSDVLSGSIFKLLQPIFNFVERYTFKRAKKVNLVSKGFEEYFGKRYPGLSYSYFTNGIDDDFLLDKTKLTPYKTDESKVVSITYAGNIGEGQGLHLIVPELASRLESEVTFNIVGDGGRKPELVSRCKDLNNVSLLDPIERSQLIDVYLSSDILFLHLNDYDAFKKVLPSKIFEYAAMGKPILAGVSGYANQFLKENVVNCAVFNPCDVDEAVDAYKSLKLTTSDRSEFIQNFSRVVIMEKMSKDIASVLESESK